MTWGLAVQESLLQFLVSLREALSMQISGRKKKWAVKTEIMYSLSLIFFVKAKIFFQKFHTTDFYLDLIDHKWRVVLYLVVSNFKHIFLSSRAHCHSSFISISIYISIHLCIYIYRYIFKRRRESEYCVGNLSAVRTLLWVFSK